MNKKIENEELVKRILNQIHKSDENTEISEEDLASIENIALTRLLENGKDTGINVEDIFLFKNLKSVTLKNYLLTMKDLQVISEHPQLEDVSFFGCQFEDINFDELHRLPENLKFIYCPSMPLKFPKVGKVMVAYSDLDFDSIDLSCVTNIRIKNSIVRNAKDLVQYPNIIEANFDGSKLMQKDGQVIENINVGNSCRYSHNPHDIYQVDDLRKDPAQKDEENFEK